MNSTPLRRFAATCTSVVLIALAGCATSKPGSVSPLAAQFFTAAAVSEAVKGQPDLRDKLKAVQPVVCAVTTKQTLTPEDIIAAVESVSGTEDTYALVNVIMGIYVTAMGGQSSTNDPPDWRPYADAVWCKGFKAGLTAPRALNRGAQAQGVYSPAVASWPMLKAK